MLYLKLNKNIFINFLLLLYCLFFLEKLHISDFNPWQSLLLKNIIFMLTDEKNETFNV